MLKDLIRYTDVANRKMIAAFQGSGKALPEAERLFSHILNSTRIWISRIKGETPVVDRFDLLPVEEFSVWNQQNIDELYHILEYTDLAVKVSYSNSQGDKFNDAVSDILFHLVNHSTYHRAQVATQFRINGVKPPATDYIFLKRQGEI